MSFESIYEIGHSESVFFAKKDNKIFEILQTEKITNYRIKK